MIVEAKKHENRELARASQDQFEARTVNSEEDNEKDRLTKAHFELSRSLLSYAFLRVHNKVLSEDLVQETFLRAWKYIKRGGHISMMKAFLYHILNGLIIDEYRKEKHAICSLDRLTEDGFDVSTNEHKHKGESVDKETAMRYIEKLPDKYRSVVYMRLIMYMSIDEIAERLQRTKNSVTVLLHRGIKRVQAFHIERCKKMNLYTPDFNF